MALSEETIREAAILLAPLCQARTDGRESLVRYETKGNRISLVEDRRLFIDRNKWFSCPVAQFEYEQKTGIWKLYWYDLKGRRHQHPNRDPAPTLASLVSQVSKDFTGIFWE